MRRPCCLPAALLACWIAWFLRRPCCHDPCCKDACDVPVGWPAGLLGLRGFCEPGCERGWLAAARQIRNPKKKSRLCDEMRLFFDNPTKLKNYRVFLHVRSSRENTKSVIQKKCRTSATKCTFFCLPVLLMALGGQTFKNTWFFDDPAGLSEKNVRTSATKC